MRALVLVLVLVFMPIAASANLRVHNAGSHSIAHVYLSLPDGSPWGEDQLPSSIWIDPGYYYDFGLSYCRYDVSIGYSDGDSQTWWNFDTCAGDLWTHY